MGKVSQFGRRWRRLGTRNGFLIIVLVGFAVYWSATSGVDEAQRIAASNRGDLSRCNIKGNVNLRGEHIYHVPGGRYYGVTQVNSIRGERWFCSRWEALRAGWRPSIR